MKTSRYLDSQIMAILKQAEAGLPTPELCRERWMSSATFYKWQTKFGGMDASLMTRMKELEGENRWLKKMYAEERLKYEIIHEAIVKKWWSHLYDERWLWSQSKLRGSVSEVSPRNKQLNNLEHSWHLVFRSIAKNH